MIIALDSSKVVDPNRSKAADLTEASQSKSDPITNSDKYEKAGSTAIGLNWASSFIPIVISISGLEVASDVSKRLQIKSLWEHGSQNTKTSENRLSIKEQINGHHPKISPPLSYHKLIKIEFLSPFFSLPI